MRGQPVSARYEQRRTLARGGMSSITLAYDLIGQREVAFKRMTASEPAARERAAALFRSEYETLKRLAHPNIVEVYEFGYDALSPYYTMELLSGSDLTRLAPLPVSEACRILRDVASALALVHARRLVHRDLSPNNVRLTAQGQAKLIDFGALTRFGVPNELVGTPPFIAPECLRSQPIDQRSDLYSLGALAYFCFTGKTHLPARTLADLRRTSLAPVERPSLRVPALPRELEELVMSLLDPDPLARPASAAEVIERLTSLAGLPPEADELSVAESYLHDMPLVGRRAISQELQQALTGALAGAGQLIVLQAERGVGRSALLDAFAIDAQLSGALVLKSDGAVSSEPFRAARELVRAGAALPPDPSEASSMLAETVASGSERARSAIDASEQQANTVAALRDSLLRLCERLPLVLLVDDVHTLDADSLAVLAGVCEQAPGHPLLVVATLLTNAAGEQPAALLHLVARSKRLEVQPLHEAELAEVVHGMFGRIPHSAQLARFLFERTGGNLAYSHDIVRGLIARKVIRYDRATFSLPHDVGELFQLFESAYADAEIGRLAGIDALGLRLATALALHAGTLEVQQLASAVDASSPAALRSLDELCKRRVAARWGDKFACHSEALRTALVRTLGHVERIDMHRKLAGVLDVGAQGSLEARLALARHLLEAGALDELAGANLLAQTADEHRFQVAMRREALPLFERALHVLQRHGFSDQDCVGLLVPLSLAGFYGSLELQRKYLDRTVLALSALCGVTLAGRLGQRVGPTAGLYLGLAAGFVRYRAQPKTHAERSFLDLLQALMSVVVPATAAAASAFDPNEAFRISSWLAPFAAAPERSGMFCVREFCLATAELIAGSIHTASRRYDHVREIFEHPVLGVDTMLREQGVLGSLHGTAQGMATDCNPKCLELADELARRGAFYAPHAETVRMTHFAFRGESQLAEFHLQRAESLAFQGSTAWSALSVLCGRSVQAYVLTGNVIGLMRVVTDLQRMASLAPTMAALSELAGGHLLLMRGQLEEAIEVYERVLDTKPAMSLCTYPLERALHVRALGQRGAYESARERAHAVITYVETARQESDVVWRLPRQELAIIEAHQGDFTRAVALLEACLPRASRYGSPLALGALHRDYARVYALQNDALHAREHFTKMEEHFRATQNPWLIQQCSVLRAKLAQLGLMPPAADVGLATLLPGKSANDVSAAAHSALDLETALTTALYARG